MREVFLVKGDDRIKAEEIVKKDETVNRGSILLRSADALGIDEGGYFLVVEGSEEIVSRARDLLKGIAKPYKNKDKVLAVIDEEEDSAIEGFGNILGG